MGITVEGATTEMQATSERWLSSFSSSSAAGTVADAL